MNFRFIDAWFFPSLVEYACRILSAKNTVTFLISHDFPSTSARDVLL